MTDGYTRPATAEECAAEASAIAQAFRGQFLAAAAQASAEEIQQWLHAHRDELPATVYGLMAAAHNAALVFGCYGDREEAED